MFYANAVLIMRYGVVYAALVSSTVQLVSTVFFSIGDIVGDANVVPFSWYPVGGCFVVLLGVAIKGVPNRMDVPPQQKNVEMEPVNQRTTTSEFRYERLA